MDPATINSTTITLTDGASNPIPAAVAYTAYSLTASLRPTNLLAYSTTYQATVTIGVRDAAGNALAAPFVGSFTTTSNPDTTAPSVVSVSPADGITCAPTGGTVSATFNEDLDPATVNAATFTLTGTGNQAVSGAVNYSNRTAAFSPSAALPLSSPFMATLTTGITDLAGNPLASSYQWNFTTVASQGVGTWVPTSMTGVPFERDSHVSVWTGSEMIVAGGLAWDSDFHMFSYTSQYGRYNPVTGMWTVSTGAPTAAFQQAVWTGSRMLVWGGYENGGVVTSGAAFDPGANAWTPIATTDQPAPRYNHTAVWTGSEMIVWGGRGSQVFGNGARYSPASDTWLPVSTLGAPSARYGHTAVWTGSEMIVWGGQDATGSLDDGARYNPSMDSWTPIAATGAPSGRMGHVAVWTGAEMIVWSEGSGGINSGGRYNPTTDSWRATDTLCAPSGRGYAPAIWTGTRMIVWSGARWSTYLADGAAYDPVANTWEQISTTGAPTARASHTAVWTGSEMIIWGGDLQGDLQNSGGRLTP
jgi:N-acetylneuraminic acid mutarotase